VADCCSTKICMQHADATKYPAYWAYCDLQDTINGTVQQQEDIGCSKGHGL